MLGGVSVSIQPGFPLDPSALDPDHLPLGQMEKKKNNISLTLVCTNFKSKQGSCLPPRGPVYTAGSGSPEATGHPSDSNCLPHHPPDCQLSKGRFLPPFIFFAALQLSPCNTVGNLCISASLHPYTETLAHNVSGDSI